MDYGGAALVAPSHIALGLLFILLLIAFGSLLTRARPKKSISSDDGLNKLYEDQDGSATVESQSEYSDMLPGYIIFAGCLLGTLGSLAGSLSSTIHQNEGFFIGGWLTFASWVDDNKPISRSLGADVRHR